MFDTLKITMYDNIILQFKGYKGVAIMVQITEIAAQKVKEVMASQNKDNLYLRLYVAGFG